MLYRGSTLFGVEPVIGIPQISCHESRVDCGQVVDASPEKSSRRKSFLPPVAAALPPLYPAQVVPNHPYTAIPPASLEFAERNDPCRYLWP